MRFLGNMTEGEFELKYLSKRVEYPFAGSHRQFELHGNNGIFHLKVPASGVEAGQPAVLKVELQPFEGWSHGWFAVKERRDVLRQSMEVFRAKSNRSARTWRTSISRFRSWRAKFTANSSTRENSSTM
jgi:hypothetical protein